MCANLMLLLKSHKDPGEVSVRTVHSLPSFSLEGLSRWVMQKCRLVMKDFTQLISSSKQVVDRIQRVRVDGYLILAKIDIKDFYTVGEHYKIAGAVAKLFSYDKDLCSLVHDVVFFLLDNQYVQSLGSQYQVLRGAGIGLLHAGDIADAVFYSLVEKQLLSENAYAVEGGVADWYRFRDDMCFVIT